MVRVGSVLRLRQDSGFVCVRVTSGLSLIHISEPTRQAESRMPSSA